MYKILATKEATPETDFIVYDVPANVNTRISLMKVTSSKGNQAWTRFAIHIVKAWDAPNETNRFHVQETWPREERIEFNNIGMEEDDMITIYVRWADTRLTVTVFWEEKLYNTDERYTMIDDQLTRMNDLTEDQLIPKLEEIRVELQWIKDNWVIMNTHLSWIKTCLCP